MTLFPELQLGWLNGWLLLAIFYGVFGLLLIIFPAEVVKRLYDRSGWIRQDYIRRAIGAPVALAIIGLFVFLPLQLGTFPFWIGLAIYVVALVIFNVALINYRNTPLDRPVTQGLYRYSRNPQTVGLLLAFVGTAVAVGAWLLVLLVAVMSLSVNTRILAEERACLTQYGESYREYMARVPRYFGWPRPAPETGAGQPHSA